MHAWQSRLFGLSGLTAAQKGQANILILEKPEHERNLYVPDDAVYATPTVEALLKAAAAQQAPRDGGGVIDSSESWVEEMLKVDWELPLPTSVDDVKDFLSSKLPKPLPVFAGQLQSLLYNVRSSKVAAEHLADCGTAHSLACIVGTVFEAVVRQTPCSEIASIGSFIMPAVDDYLMKLASISQLLHLSSDRDTIDNSQATLPSSRPDCCVWINSALVLKGEDKSPKRGSTLLDAIHDLRSKMARQWCTLTMGSLPFLLCYASCGPLIQFHIIMRDCNTPNAISQVWDMAQPVCRISVLHMATNIFRLLRLLEFHVPDRGRLALGQVMERQHGVTITIKMSSVDKVIKNFNIQPNANSDFELLQAVYSATKGVRNLVHCVSAPQCINNTYRVELQPLGYHCHPETESDLKSVMHAVLSALAALHELKYVHRDVRWDNVLRDEQGSWFLTDLESAAKEGEQPGKFSCCAWTATTLVNGLYTTASDIEMAGQLMTKAAARAGRMELSDSGSQLAQRMQDANATARPTAVMALGDEWFRGS